MKSVEQVLRDKLASKKEKKDPSVLKHTAAGAAAGAGLGVAETLARGGILSVKGTGGAITGAGLGAIIGAIKKKKAKEDKKKHAMPAHQGTWTVPPPATTTTSVPKVGKKIRPLKNPHTAQAVGTKGVSTMASLSKVSGAMSKEARFGALKAGLKNSAIGKMFASALADEGVKSGLKKALVFGTAGAGLTAGIRGADAAIDSIRKPLHKRRSFNNMMEDNPSLKREDEKDVKRIFNTLHRFNPEMASDPLVSGSFMRRALQFKEEGIQPVDVKTLAEVGKLSREGRNKESLLKAMFGSAL